MSAAKQCSYVPVPSKGERFCYATIKTFHDCMTIHNLITLLPNYATYIIHTGSGIIIVLIA